MASESGTFSVVVHDKVAEWLNYGQQQELIGKSRGSNIQRVPQLLREMGNNQSCYDPRVVSLGPYHHGKQELLDVEKLKPGIALQYVESSHVGAKELYDRVAKVSIEARECYAEGSTEMFDDEAFTRMMFLDACFVLRFLYGLVDKNQKAKLSSHVAGFVKRDLFLLENQIPLLVLKALHHRGDQTGYDLDHLMGASIRLILPDAASGKSRNQNSKVLSGKKSGPGPVHLLEHLWNELAGEANSDNKHKGENNWSSYRSAKELRSVGIHFKPSKSHLLSDISFWSAPGIGLLRLPRVIIDDTTKSTLLNLVAYEAHADKNFQVTSYICFMNELIDQAEDVKELRSNGILLNCLGSDQQVADMFTDIANELVLDPYHYIGVKHHLEKYYRNRITIWMAEWLHKHFNSPWTVLAFLGALLALGLTIVQTYLDVLDSLGRDKNNCKPC